VYIPTLEDKGNTFSVSTRKQLPHDGHVSARRAYTLIIFIQRLLEILLYGNMQSREYI
jgi:hypothetical protein